MKNRLTEVCRNRGWAAAIDRGAVRDATFRIVAGLVLIGPIQAHGEAIEARVTLGGGRTTMFRAEAGPGTLSPKERQQVDWIPVREKDSGTAVETGSRIVVEIEPGALRRILHGSSLEVSRQITERVFILQAPDPWVALREAERLAGVPGVTASHPVRRRQASIQERYAYKPHAAYFNAYQYYLENRFADGRARGADINVRAAWPWTRGAGVIVAVADSGFELDHPDLSQAAAGAPHFNFESGTSDGSPPSSLARHGTAVAGLVAARSPRLLSMMGVAPEAGLASWVVHGEGGMLVSEEKLMDAFQYQSNAVQVQNHSWGNPGQELFEPSVLERIGISNAITFGRDGRGVIMTRAAGNSRMTGGNANDDAYASDPRVIAVAAARVGGRAASYSNPGASILVAAVGGDALDGVWQLTTDLQGPAGYSAFRLFSDPDFWNYTTTFYGTSAAAPQIAGIAALMLSVNPGLTYRDVQQILILSARHFDKADPGLKPNGAGFLVSHNLGFGIADAGHAVQLARGWSNRPPQVSLTLVKTNSKAIPDDGLRLLISGEGIPAHLRSIRVLPGTGLHADEPTAGLRLVDVGRANFPIAEDLSGAAALIERGGTEGGTNFADKVGFAAEAGAAFAVIHNFATNTPGSGAPGGDQLIPVAGTDYSAIPAVFISHSDGMALKELFASNSTARAGIRLFSTHYTFDVGTLPGAGNQSLLCEHVGVRVKTDHPLRGDLRLTLVSPSGTRSILQQFNGDTSPGPEDWTYFTTHHFFEPAAGAWQLYISDQFQDFSGTVLEASLILYGTAIEDADADGLDDRWEMAHFGSLHYGATDDPDGDGYSNAREQAMGGSPVVAEIPFDLDLSRWNEQRARLSWAGREGRTYEVWSGASVTALTLVTNVPGRFPVTEWFTGYTGAASGFFQVRIAPQ